MKFHVHIFYSFENMAQTKSEWTDKVTLLYTPFSRGTRGGLFNFIHGEKMFALSS